MSVLAGWQLIATLSTKTPLEWLLRDREVVDTPYDVPMQWAAWAPKTKSFRELGIDVDEPPPGTRASEIGQVPKDGGDFLPFLIQFRSIVQSDQHREAVLQELTDLSRKHQVFSEKLGGDLAELFVCRELAELPGCGSAAAKKLYAAGYTSKAEVLATPPEVLARTPGIGLATARRMQGNS